MVAKTTNVTESTHIWNIPLSLGVMNCGKKATKKTMLFGFSTVTKYVLANNLKCDESGVASGISVGEKPARSSLIPR
ncbi:hypothetical protein HPA02_31900 [Bisbaumannia pacifica]|uniref:Uncharacterized protein n=1 Tax=Bisbaumannia pacifica TaxID=77098 RepID=A0A510XDX0_9GAMM|nr:hypothetical protein HPA02_31900 [Halomonas pacifica]